ncbi:cyclic nucleotide-binding domain-containing protein [Chryseotalea sanaruensis]|uniref:Cyclic nucleotide-binding domain-containing protein n=1 Tax=Chryseotalea sanaruensis TaxID=2482724 RepID=A0A401U563_9BACT|nr:Crp/Fnr family transcriptional regulator [Chryseotalea sanaruensis]GCC50047.1 cyclic nucleotide-binding domain-containing protein [Chryseotalea sanaruensis]
MNSLDLLKSATTQIQPLSDSAWKDFSSCWKNFSVKRKETITKAGEKEPYLYFVTEGVQRIYYLDDTRESTVVLTYAPSFGGVMDSFLLQKPSHFYYEALTPSVFLRADYESINVLMDKHPAILKLVHIGLTQAFSGLLERMVELQCFSSEEKFKKLLQRSPHILTLVSHKYLANYLGNDATNFSKLINSVRV